MNKSKAEGTSCTNADGTTGACDYKMNCRVGASYEKSVAGSCEGVVCTPPNDCWTSECDGGSCLSKSKPEGTSCTNADGTTGACDYKMNCRVGASYEKSVAGSCEGVVCTPPNDCWTSKCDGGSCMNKSKAEGTSCTNADGTTGACDYKMNCRVGASYEKSVAGSCEGVVCTPP